MGLSWDSNLKSLYKKSWVVYLLILVGHFQDVIIVGRDYVCGGTATSKWEKNQDVVLIQSDIDTDRNKGYYIYRLVA